MALRAAGEQLSRLRGEVAPQDELVRAVPAAGTGFASQFASYGADLPQLFLHEHPP
jgi:hypothetical protein